MSTDNPHEAQTGDYVHFALMTAQLAACWYFLSVAWRRKHSWPPFQARNLPNVTMFMIGGTMWGFIGFFETNLRLPGALASSNCNIIGVLSMIGLLTYQVCVTVRLYRLYQLFVRGNAKMFSSVKQAVLLGSVQMVVVLTTGFEPHVFDPATRTCVPRAEQSAIQLLLGSFILLWSMVWCAINVTLFVKIRKIRSQFNEIKPAYGDAIAYCIGWMPFILGFAAPDFVNNNPVAMRNWTAWVTYGACVLKFITTMGPSLVAYYTNDTDFRDKYVVGLRSIDKELISGPMADQLEEPRLYEIILKFAKTTYSEENIYFYNDARKRKELTDLDDVIAETYRIIQKYIRDDAEQVINISSTRREEIMLSDGKHAVDLFDAAMQDVLYMIEYDIKPCYMASEEYKQLVEEMQKESGELDRLNASNMIPDAALSSDALRLKRLAGTPTSRRISNIRSTIARSPGEGLDTLGTTPDDDMVSTKTSFSAILRRPKRKAELNDLGKISDTESVSDAGVMTKSVGSVVSGRVSEQEKQQITEQVMRPAHHPSGVEDSVQQQDARRMSDLSVVAATPVPSFPSSLDSTPAASTQLLKKKPRE